MQRNYVVVATNDVELCQQDLEITKIGSWTPKGTVSTILCEQREEENAKSDARQPEEQWTLETSMGGQYR